MNMCTFYGRILEDPKLNTTDTNKVVFLKLEVESYRKIVSLNKKLKETVVVECEAWDSAAETIYKNCLVGEYILVQCKYRNNAPFRITEFTYKTIFRRNNKDTQ